MSKDPNSAVLFSEHPTADGNVIGKATLNTPKSLNSLTLPMIKSLRETFAKWKDRRDVVAVWLDGAGDKGFCAGGDIIQLFEAMKTNDYKSAEAFFEHEYSLDLSIHKWTKPMIVWGDGVVMGGGMGLMQGAKFRIVTERTMMAMPEITIGLYPDVGASYFLHKSPKPYGFFEALTGARLNATDALKMNFADYFVPSQKKDDVFLALTSLSFKPTEEQNMMLITDLLMKQSPSDSDTMPESQLEKHSEWIEQTFAESDLAALDLVLRQHQSDDKWLSRSLNSYKNGSPISAALIAEQFRRSQDWSLEKSFQNELAMSSHCARGGEFLEGVRALLIDKDNSPKWKRKTLSEVTPEQIAAHFEMPQDSKLELRWMF
jgi:enoyl-CoA hydratase/carnithine racemase